MGDEGKTRERPTMGRIRELETKLTQARSDRDRAEEQVKVMAQRLDAKVSTIRGLHEGQAQDKKALAEAAATIEDLRKDLEAVNTGDTPGYTVVPDGDVIVAAEALSRLLDEIREAGQVAYQKAQDIKHNAKASYADRLHRAFLEGTAKTSAYFLDQATKLAEDKHTS